MAITLAQFKVGMRDHIDQKVIETIERNSLLMDKLTWDDAVSASGNGSTLTYGYLQLKTPAAANGRALNADYTPATAERQEKTVDLKIMGASYEIDRVLAKNSDAAINEVSFQNDQATKGVTGYFQYLTINATKSADSFDGLSALLTGTGNEFTDGIDISGTMTEAKAEELCEALDDAIAALDDTTNVVILTNGKAKTKITAAARMLSYHKQDKDDLGRVVDYYNGYPIIDLKSYYNGSATVEVIPVTTKLTDIYVVRLGLDAFHAVSPKGGVGLDVIMPDFSQAGAVHKGEVELVGAVALKNTNAAAVIRKVQVTV